MNLCYLLLYCIIEIDWQKTHFFNSWRKLGTISSTY